jgi:UDP-N-acetylmuramate dehydrogenase
MNSIKTFSASIQAAGFTGTIERNVTLGPLTYYRIGGPALEVATPHTLNDCERLAQYLREQPEQPVFILGKASNVLVSDDGFHGLIIRTHKLVPQFEHQDNRLTIGAGMLNALAIKRCIQEGLSGLECLAGIPGSIGGAVFMNAGNSLGQTQDKLLAVSLFNLKTGTYHTHSPTSDCFSYRRNHFLRPCDLILSATFQVEPTSPLFIEQKVSSLLEKRKQSQPIAQPSCGSVFKNPPGHSAWKLIDNCGLRGKSLGDAEFSSKHPNFIVNNGQARAAEVKALIFLAQKQVLDKFGIELQTEVIFL